MKNNPDKWAVLKIGNTYKVFAMWSGGYLDGDSWKLSSGITKVEDSEEWWDFYNVSGSVYRCRKTGYGCNVYGAAVLYGWMKKDFIVMMDEETNWLEIKNEK